MLCVLTQAPPPETKVNLHFVSIVQKDGHLYELGEAGSTLVGPSRLGSDSTLVLSV